MAIITLTFTNPINTSVQVGDMVLYCNPTGTATYDATTGTATSFSTSAQSDVVFLGECIVLAADRLSMNVDYDNTTTIAPTTSSFILFSKDKYSNPSGIVGYYGKVCFTNDSKTEAELFGINADMFISSK